MNDLKPETLSWTALLGRWVEFAQAALALPDDAAGRRWREATRHVIQLQAVTFALADLERVEPEDRPHARDRAEILIDQSERAAREIWRDAAVPEAMVELLLDARSALAASVYAGLTELVWPGPGDMLMPHEIPLEEVIARGGTLAMAQPGTILLPGEPAAWWCDRSGNDLRTLLPHCLENTPTSPRQVYRIFNEDGTVARDVIAALNDHAPDAAMPLLVPLLHQGNRIGTFTLDAREWEQRQRDAMLQRDAKPL